MIILLKMTKKDFPKSYKYLSAYLSLRCNLNCGFCVNNSIDNFKRNIFDEISGEEWVNALNQFNLPYDVPVSLVGGEPSLHRDFIYILNNLNPEFGIDIVTNLWWKKNKLEEFIKKVSPERIDNHAPFPSIRVSYHPEQMGEGEKLIDNTLELKKAGFDIGIECIMYPSSFQLEALERMAIKCKNVDIPFRPKSFIGVYEGRDKFDRPFRIEHGSYYPDSKSVFGDETLECMCKGLNFLINPAGSVYKCTRDLLSKENPIGDILNPDFQIEDKFRYCKKYGECYPCDTKIKTDNKQELGNVLVEIKDIKPHK